jgi:hypothetical protein
LKLKKDQKHKSVLKFVLLFDVIIKL